MESLPAPLSNSSTVDQGSSSMATNDPVTVHNLSVVEGGNASSNSNDGVGADALDSRDMNTGSRMPTRRDPGGPTAIPAEEGDVANPLETLPSAIGVKPGVEAVTPREWERSTVACDDDGNSHDGERTNEEGNNEDDNESEYSYDYEEEDETNLLGFLIPTEPFESGVAASKASRSRGGNASASSMSGSKVNVVVALDNEDSAESGESNAVRAHSISRGASLASDDAPVNPSPGKERRQKWREPTQAAINMSLRAEKEKTGGRRRLASDLYRIMTADTKEAGFSLMPCNEDSMDKWCIKLFGFDEDSNLAKDLMVCGMDHVELEMSFPEQYPFEPPFVRVVRPRFKKQTGFVMNGALCMELLTKDGWNPINDIESVIVSIRSLMVVGDGRLQTAVEMGKDSYETALSAALEKKTAKKDEKSPQEDAGSNRSDPSELKRKRPSEELKGTTVTKEASAGSYTAAEASAAYEHLSKFHKNNGWDRSGWWAKKG